MNRRAFSTVFLNLALVASAWGQHKEPLFINLASAGQRATMALTFGTRQLEQGHPVTLFINGEAVRVASLANKGQYAKQQELIENLLDLGATILVAPMFMSDNGVSPKDLMPGLTLSSPTTGTAYLYRPHTQTLSW
jgi:predicted peroxiredoxin